MKHHFFLPVMITIASIFSSATAFACESSYVDASGIARSADGKICKVPFEYALTACWYPTKPATARELAKLSQSMGAKGILEIKDVGRHRPPPGYNLISGFNDDGKFDQFYFSREGYVRPQNDMGNEVFWSLTLMASAGHFPIKNYGYVLLGQTGDITDTYTPWAHAVLCF